MKLIIENFAKLLALTSFSLLTIATVHDWGYFLVVGSKFRSIQTTYDYVTEAIEWMPAFFLACLLFAGQAFIAAWVIQSDKYGFDDRRRAKTISEMKFLVLFLIVGSFIAIGYTSIDSSVTESLVWIVLGGSLLAMFSSMILLFAFRKSRLLLIVAGLGLLGAVFGLGLSQGFESITKPRDVYRVSLKSGGAQNFSLLRTFERGVLVRNLSESRTDFIRWDQIDLLSRYSRTDKESGICRMLGFRCKTIVVEP